MCKTSTQYTRTAVVWKRNLPINSRAVNNVSYVCERTATDKLRPENKEKQLEVPCYILTRVVSSFINLDYSKEVNMFLQHSDYFSVGFFCFVFSFFLQQD